MTAAGFKAFLITFALLISSASAVAQDKRPTPRAEELLERSKQMQRAGRLDEAALLLGEAVKLEPGWAEPYFELGQIDLARFRKSRETVLLDNAIKTFGKAAELDPSLPRAYTEAWRARLLKPDFEREVGTIRAEIGGLQTRSRGEKRLRETVLKAAIEGYSLIGDDEAKARTEQEIVSEFPESPEARQVLLDRAFAEKDTAARASLIESFIARYPQAANWTLYSNLFRGKAAGGDDEKLLKIGERWVESGRGDPYQFVEASSSVSIALAERRIELDRAQIIADAASKLVDGLTPESPLLQKIDPSDRQNLTAFLRELARTAKGFVLLRRGKTEEAGELLEVALTPVINEVEKRGFIVWKDLNLRELGVRPRVLWLAELYEARRLYDRAARYLLAAYCDDRRANSFIGERLPVVYERVGLDRSKAIASIEEARRRFESLAADPGRSKESARQAALANRLEVVAPDFEVTTVDRRKLRLSEMKGKVVVLNFWATWCGPCVAELPYFEKAAGRYAASSEAVFLAVSLDENRARVGPFMQKHGLKIPTAFGLQLSEPFNISGIPATLIIDRAGVIRFRDTGFGGAGESYIERIIWRVDDLLKPTVEREK